MEAFFKVAKREIYKIKKRPLILIVLLAVPLITCFILASTFVAGSPRELPIAILDQDNTNITRKISRMVDATPTCAIKYKVNDLEEGRKLITGGQIYALIFIPRNFTRDIKRGTHPQLVYYYNNQMILIGGLITKDVATTVQTAMAGFDVNIQMKKGLPKDAVLRKVNVIRLDEHIHSNPYLNYCYFLSYATFAHTFQIIIAFLAIWTIGIEFKEGTTKEWLQEANDSILIGVFGKLFVYIICFLFLISLTYYIYIILYGAPFEGNILFLLLGTIAFILSYQLMGIMFVAITSNLRLSFSCGAFYTSLGFTFAGMTYPNMAMPLFGRAYSSLLPVRPYVNLVVDQIMRGFQPHYDLIYIWWMLGLAIFGSLFLPLLKKHAQNERQWFKL